MEEHDKPSCYNCRFFIICWFRIELARLVSRFPMLSMGSDGYKLLNETVAAMCQAYEYGLEDPPAALAELSGEEVDADLGTSD